MKAPTMTTPAAPSHAHALAGAFAAILYDWASPVEWAVMRVSNVGADSSFCASHDFCDANMAMARAFEVLGIPDPVGGEGEEKDAATDLWNEAWAIAKRDYLTEGASLDDLTGELEAFYKAEGMAPMCAEEALAGDLTDTQRGWLSRFVARFDALQDAADLAETVRAHGAA